LLPPEAKRSADAGSRMTQPPIKVPCLKAMIGSSTQVAAGAAIGVVVGLAVLVLIFSSGSSD
jgi:hypothetical protein